MNTRNIVTVSSKGSICHKGLLLLPGTQVNSVIFSSQILERLIAEGALIPDSVAPESIQKIDTVREQMPPIVLDKEGYLAGDVVGQPGAQDAQTREQLQQIKLAQLESQALTMVQENAEKEQAERDLASRQAELKEIGEGATLTLDEAKALGIVN